jgi:hypothetical protein
MPEGEGFGLWALGFGLWALGFGLWALGFGLWALGFGLWALGFGLWALGFGLWARIAFFFSVKSQATTSQNTTSLKALQSNLHSTSENLLKALSTKHKEQRTKTKDQSPKPTQPP